MLVNGLRPSIIKRKDSVIMDLTKPLDVNLMAPAIDPTISIQGDQSEIKIAAESFQGKPIPTKLVFHSGNEKKNFYLTQVLDSNTKVFIFDL